jgi:hypothetical protein
VKILATAGRKRIAIASIRGVISASRDHRPHFITSVFAGFLSAAP